MKHQTLKFVLPAIVIALSLIATASLVIAQPVHEGNSISIPAKDIKFRPTGVKTQIGELMAGQAFGDFTTGKHGTFVLMPVGFVSPVHTHTEDYYAVVIKGVGVNGPVGSKDILLPTGSYFFQRGEEAHVTKCVSKIPCLFFLSQPGKFDFLPK